MLELKGHRPILRRQTVGVVGMPGEVLVRDVELVLLRLDVPDLLDRFLQASLDFQNKAALTPLRPCLRASLSLLSADQGDSGKSPFLTVVELRENRQC